MRRQAIAQYTKARRQHINRECARLTELQYTIDILLQQEQRQEALLDHIHYQPTTNPSPPPPNQIPHQPPPPLPQLHVHQQQIEAFLTYSTILTITGGSNTDFDTKRQR
jgi:hypothetical protein